LQYWGGPALSINQGDHSSNQPAGLQVQPGKTLALLGGDVGWMVVGVCRHQVVESSWEEWQEQERLNVDGNLS